MIAPEAATDCARDLDALAGAGAGRPARDDDAIDVSALYDGLGRDLVSREERLEVTSLVAGGGVALLVVAVAVSLIMSGRLP